MAQENEFSFEEELYQAISMLSFWDEGSVSATKGGVLFNVSDISAVEGFNASGIVSLDIRDEERPVEFLSIDLILAKGADKEKTALFKQKLYDVNLGFKNGMFYVDDEQNFCFESNFPVIRSDIETSLKLFITQYIDIMNYLDGVYPFILKVISHPENADFDEYIVAMAGEEGEEA